DQRPQQRGRAVDRGRDLEAVGLEQPDQPVPQQEEVLGDNGAHGTSMMIMVGPPGGLLTASMPSKVPSRRSTPCSPVPWAGSAPPAPSSVTSIRSTPAAGLTAGRRGAGVYRMRICTRRAPECLTALASASATAK